LILEIEDVIWSKNFIAVIQEIVGDSSVGFESCTLHLEYGQLANITFSKKGWEDQVYFCDIYGTNALSDVVKMPQGVQAITLTCKVGEYTTGQVRFVPVDPEWLKFFESLKGIKFYLAEVMT
jgi:hypothetical protein